jgi:hypothetical protein
MGRAWVLNNGNQQFSHVVLVRSQRLQLFVRNCERCKMHICDAMHAS